MSPRYLELSYREDRIGEWKTTTARAGRSDWCLWEAQRSLDGHSKATYFALSGDSHGPDRALLDELYQVLSNLGAIKDLVDKEIRQCTPTGTVADFYLSGIRDWDRHDDILQIDFAPVGPRILQEQRMLSWPRTYPGLDHRVVLQTLDVRIAPGQLVERGLV